MLVYSEILFPYIHITTICLTNITTDPTPSQWGSMLLHCTGRDTVSLMRCTMLCALLTWSALPKPQLSSCFCPTVFMKDRRPFSSQWIKHIGHVWHFQRCQNARFSEVDEMCGTSWGYLNQTLLCFKLADPLHSSLTTVLQNCWGQCFGELFRDLTLLPSTFLFSSRGKSLLNSCLLSDF